MAGIRRPVRSLPMVDTPEDVLLMVRTIKSLEVQAMFSLLYLTGARISEIAGVLRGNQITMASREIRGKTVHFIHLINVITLKKRLKGRPLSFFNRVIPIPIDRHTAPFLDIIETYITTQLQDLPEDAILFPYPRQRYNWQLKKYFSGIFPHWFRAVRSTHLIKIYNFSSHDLKEFFNWSSSVHADAYIKLSAKDLQDKFAGID